MANKFILITLIFLFSCNSYKYSYEDYIDSVYSEPFTSDGFAPDLNDPKNLYLEFESILLESGYINSISRENYLRLTEKLINDSVSLDVDKISETLGKKSFYFDSPSFSLLSFEVYQNASSKYYDEGNIAIMNKALQNTRDGGDLRSDMKKIKDFLYSINETDFQEKIIYRIPIIQLVYLHGVD